MSNNKIHVDNSVIAFIAAVCLVFCAAILLCAYALNYLLIYLGFAGQ